MFIYDNSKGADIIGIWKTDLKFFPFTFLAIQEVKWRVWKKAAIYDIILIEGYLDNSTIVRKKWNKI